VSFPEVLQFPSQQFSVDKGKTYGQEDGKKIHKTQHQQPEMPREDTHVSKGKQYDGSDGRVVHGSEQTAEYTGYDDMFSHFV
jgi:hypothetical protein